MNSPYIIAWVIVGPPDMHITTLPHADAAIAVGRSSSLTTRCEGGRHDWCRGGELRSAVVKQPDDAQVCACVANCA